METKVPEQIKSAFTEKFPNAHTNKVNVSWDACCSNQAVEILIVDDQFQDMKLLQRHKFIKSILEPYNDDIHKVVIKTHTVEEATKKGLI